MEMKKCFLTEEKKKQLIVIRILTLDPTQPTKLTYKLRTYQALYATLTPSTMTVLKDAMKAIKKCN